MKAIVLLVCVCFSGIGKLLAKPTEKSEWVIVPDKDFTPTLVNLAKVLGEVQPYLEVDVDVRFELYTLANPSKPDILSPYNLTSITASHFNNSVPTRIYIHGFQERGAMKSSINDAYLKKARKDVNLIYVNWEKYSRTWNYVDARYQVDIIGAHVARLIDFMVYNELVDLNDISVIGFSLGAHIAGMTGKNVQSGILPKIVGLDPAGPLFSIDKPSQRLDKHDAKYVEVIHTNGALLGMFDHIGTVSFYPNHGMLQLGCILDFTGLCSHLRAYAYFSESIYSNISFYSYPCDSLDQMKKSECGGVGLRMGGEPGNYRAEADIYYLPTNSKPIFAQGGSRDM